MSKFEEALLAGRALRSDVRDENLFKLAHDERFSALLGLIQEMQDDLSESAGSYDRTEREQTMDCGGIYAFKELKNRLHGIMEPPPKESPEAETK